jgi:drug/metabolite transporter (DMT)-like permease
MAAMTAAPLTRPTPIEPRAAAWLPAFVALAAIWGSSFLLIKVGVRELHPAYVTLFRCAAGALTLVIVLLVTRDRLPSDRRLWAQMALLAFIGNVVPFTLFGYGEQRVSSIIAGIWNGTTPLMVLLVSLAFLPEERPTRQRVAGLLLGFVGVLVVLGAWRGLGGGEFVGQLSCAGAAVCYGFAIPYTRRVMAKRSASVISLAATQLIVATVELAVVAPVLGGRPPSPANLSLDVVASVLALGALGTGLAFWLNYQVIRVAGAATSASVTYVIPVFATLLGVLVLSEQLHWYEPVGAVVILVGVAISQGRPRGRTRPRGRSRPYGRTRLRARTRLRGRTKTAELAPVSPRARLPS